MFHHHTTPGQQQRCVIYSRFSTDGQNARSAADQTAACRRWAEGQGWIVVEIFEDSASSGGSQFRSGYQVMLSLAQQRGFDILMSEGLDRLSRRLADIASLHDELTFLNIKIFTLQDGWVQPIHIGLIGTMAQMQLSDLRHKTRRGLAAVARSGRSAGGRCYGYRAVQPFDQIAEQDIGQRGRRVIDVTEAAVVNRIFQEYADGKSPKAIALGLNHDAIPGPRGGKWGPSAINGDRKRGTGIINNRLYVGQQIWNRRTCAKNPATGRRIAQLNAEDAHVVTEIKSLRIVSDTLWQAAKSRQASLDLAMAARPGDKAPAPFWSKQRPKFLFSGLMRCAACGSGYSKSGAERFGCSGARNKGPSACTNTLTIRRDELETTVLSALRHRLMDPLQFEAYAKHYVAEWNRMQASAVAQLNGKRLELTKVSQQLSKLVDALADGAPVHTVRERMVDLEARKLRLARELEAAEAPAPRLYPRLAEVYRERVSELIAELQAEDSDGLRTRLRTLVDEIRLVPADGGLRVEVRGALGGILRLASGDAPGQLAGAVPDMFDLQFKMDAGTGFEPVTFRL
jgi:site-specific DNA recombinase